MIVHKHAKDKPPHAGLEYFYKSKESESVHDCVFMWCWECIFDEFEKPCKKHAEFIKKEREANECDIEFQNNVCAECDDKEHCDKTDNDIENCMAAFTPLERK